MLAKYFLLVLVFITTLVTSIYSQPPHVSLSPYQYDPNSIPQNEKILQLFLRLASHTAGKLFLLKQQTLEQQLHNLKENEKIDDASQSDLHIKNMIESFLSSFSESKPVSSNPLLLPKRNLTSVDNTIPSVINENPTISSFSYKTQNLPLQNNFQNSGLESASEERSTDSVEIPEDFGNSASSLEVQNRLMIDYDKDNNDSKPGGQNLQNANLNNQENFNLNNQQNSNPNQMSQDPGSMFTNMFNPATFANMIPMSMVSNVPVIGSGLATPINMAQEAFSKLGSFAPQARTLPQIEENLKKVNQINENSFQSPKAIENNGSSPENISVTEEASFRDQNQTNDNEGVTTESAGIFDNKITTKNSLDESTFNKTKSSSLGENSEEINSLKEENKAIDKIEDKIEDKVQDRIQNKESEKLELPKKDLEANKKNNSGSEDSRMKLKMLTDQVMKALQDMQDEIDHKNTRKEVDSSFSNRKIPTLNPGNIHPIFQPKYSVDNSEESQKIKQMEAPIIGGKNIDYNHPPNRGSQYNETTNSNPE